MGAAAGAGMSLLRDALLAALATHEGWSDAASIAGLACLKSGGWSKTSVKSALTKLAREGRIERWVLGARMSLWAKKGTPRGDAER